MDKAPASTPLIDTGRRFQWAGYFAEKLTDRGKLLLIPICGGCGAELRWGIVELEGRCRTCKRKHYMGPFYLEKLPPTVEIVDRLIKQLELQPAPVVVAEPQLLLFTGQEPPELSVGTAAQGAVYGKSLVPAKELVKEPQTDSPTAAAASISTVTQPDLSTTLHAGPVGPSDVEANWGDNANSCGETTESTWREEWDVSDVQNDTEAHEEDREMGSESGAILPLALAEEDFMLPEEAREFWVLPGEASPRKFHTISKVQRKINMEVHKRWGLFMPYAPRWVYQRVEAQLQEWINQDILQYLQLDDKSLQQPDSAARQQAQDQVKGCLAKWWLGHTVLQNHVRSVCKQAPERLLSKDVMGFDGLKVEKPHPAYYVSHEVTKRWFQRMV
ncbi:hypothetical protein XELAEV_18002025mg [Xenopus laevis]|uniref:Uncharacterized protein n=1 Tax=Xenopus laevis TaxID=8355 RepID=A0A974BPJ6_XENLA|nr:hypothetical protein XELAEV_18002025mg [Xenopus laevis]